MLLSKKILELKVKMIPVFKRYHVIKAGIFGSVAKGKQRIESDLDILVELDKDFSLLDFISMKLELEELMNCKIDLVEYKNIRPSMKDSILNDEIPIYG